jgi:exonuclease SbcC
MIPKRVTLKNFLSFGDEEQVIDFTENEALWVLTGPNGIGKSAVFDAITYCLFAEHRGGASHAKSLIRHGANALRVSFEFAFDGADHRITRTRGSNTTQKVETWKEEAWHPVAGVNQVKELDAWVTNTLGLAYEAFTKSVLLRQGESDAIILAGGKERLEMLKKIIDVARFESLAARIADAAKEHQGKLKLLTTRRGTAVGVKPEEVEAAQTALQFAEADRDAAQAAVQAAAKTVDQAKLFAKLDADRKELDAKLADADERAKHKDAIKTEHARFVTLSAAVPLLKKVAAARSRHAAAEQKHADDSAALVKLNDDFAASTAALETAKQKAVTHQAAKDEHGREAKRLEEEVTREAKFLATAEQVGVLKAELAQFPADLDAKLTAASVALRKAEDAVNAATGAKGEADSRVKAIKKQQEEFETVGATCSKCRQPVKPEFAAEEKAKLKRDAAEARKQLEAAELALTTAKHEKSSALEEEKSLAEDALARDKAADKLAIHEQTLAGIGLHSDPAKLKSELDAKRAAVKDHEKNSASEAALMTAAAEDGNRLDAAIKKQTKERDEVSLRVQTLVGELAGARTERDTLLDQLAPEWHGTVDLDELSKEHAELERSGIAKRFAALQSDSELQIQWRALRDSILAELQKLPSTSVKDAEAAHGAATSRAAAAGAARDEAKTALDQLRNAVAEFQKLLAEVAAAELLSERHRKLNAWLGKDGLLRELVRDAEREIVQHAQDTLRTLSSGDLEIELQAPSDGKDEALVLVVRRAGDPEPIPVRFLSGSQKFRVAVAIAVAIGKFAAGPAAAKPLESVIIDEGFGSLDKDGLSAMRDELENLKNSQSLKRVILVSHQEEFTKSFPIGYVLSQGENGTVATRFRQDG